MLQDRCSNLHKPTYNNAKGCFVPRLLYKLYVSYFNRFCSVGNIFPILLILFPYNSKKVIEYKLFRFGLLGIPSLFGHVDKSKHGKGVCVHRWNCHSSQLALSCSSSIESGLRNKGCRQMISTTLKLRAPVIIEHMTVKYGSFWGNYDTVFTT